MSKIPPPPRKPSTQNETCPLCGVSYNPTTGHECDDAAGAEPELEPDSDPVPQTAPAPKIAPESLKSKDELAVPVPGEVLADRYEILQELSRGGMGVVYKARHRVLNNVVAMKLLLKPGSEVDQRRFLQEAQLASKVAHPNTVYISDFGVLPDGRPFLVMEYMEGPVLSSLLKKQPKRQLDILRATRIAIQIAHGMQTVHDKGIVHRDLKPDNIFILEHGGQEGDKDFVKIVDFGIAKDTTGVAATGMPPELEAALQKARDKQLAASPSSRSVDDSSIRSGTGTSNTSNTSSRTSNLTQAGASVGTPRYMAPEQVDGKNVGPQTDQYALGCILYQLIGGKTPFDAEGSMGILAAHLVEPPQPLRQRYPTLNVPESLDKVILRMLAKKPADRYASMRDAAAALEHEVEVLSLQRGDKVVMSSGLAALLGGRQGTHIIIRGHKIPLRGVIAGGVGLLAVLMVGSFLLYRYVLTEPSTLEPGELRALEERARQVMLEEMRSGPPELRLVAMAGLSQTRDPRYREGIEALLKDPSPTTQAQAADSLGQLGTRESVPALIDVMKNSRSVPVQLASAQALVALGDEEGQKLLENELESKSEQTRLRAASLLCERGQPKALEIVSKVLEEKRVSDTVALNLLTCLSHAGDDNARQKLRMQLTKAPTPDAQLLAAAKLAQLGQEDGRAYLRERLRKPGSEQLVAARFLAAPDEPGVADLFRQVLRERGSVASAKQLAVEGLGLSGRLLDARLLGKQMDAAKEPTLKLGAATSIVLIARSAPTALSDDSMRWARSALTDSKWAIREAAVEVIGDSTAEDAVPLLAKLLTDNVAMVRQTAARALGRRKEDAAVAALRTGLKDGEASVRQEALRSLLKLSKSQSQGVRKKLSEDANAMVQETINAGTDSEKALARTLLLGLGDKSQLDGLRDLAKNGSADVRQLVVDNLSGQSDVMLSLLQDSSFAVRFGAAKQLAEAGDKRAIPVLREALDKKGPEALQALVLLRKLGEKVDLPPGLVGAVASGPLAQRLAAAEMASRLPSDIALMLLRPLAHDADSQVRRLVAGAAAELPAGPDGPAGVPILRVLAADSDPAVRARASALLVQLLPLSARVEEGTLTKAQAQAAELEKKDEEQRSSESKNKPADDNAKLDLPPPPPKPDMATADDEDPPPPDGIAGTGFIKLEGPAGIEYALDRGRWQKIGSEPIKVSAGKHTVLALSGIQKVEVKDKETLTVQISESQVEKLAAAGLEALGKKDLKKAQKLLEKATTLCNKEKKLAARCNELLIEIMYSLGQLYQEQDKLPQAMNSYQQVVDIGSSLKGRGDRVSAAQRAMKELAPSLGRVIFPKKSKKSCQEVTLYMLPGTHQIEVDGETQTVKVRGQETVRLGSCQ